MASKKTIREAVLKNRGGLQEASDAGIMTIWNSLDSQTQEKYLQSVKTERKAKDAVSSRTERQI